MNNVRRTQDIPRFVEPDNIYPERRKRVAEVSGEIHVPGKLTNDK